MTEAARASGRRVVVVLVTGFALLLLARVVASWRVGLVRRERIAENERAAALDLTALAAAQARFREVDRDGDGALEFAASIAELGAPAEQHGYVFEVRPRDPITARWAAWARPKAPGLTGERSFYIDETGVVRAQVGDVGPGSPPAR